MKARYFANDGKEFSAEAECLAYERDIALDKYVKDFQCGELKDRANRMIAWLKSYIIKQSKTLSYWKKKGRFNYGHSFNHLVHSVDKYEGYIRPLQTPRWKPVRSLS